MIFEQHYLDCLSQASYLIGDESTGRAVVVDPRRDIDPYLESAREHELTIELILETHFHADFVSGHLELAEATGAEIGYGSVAHTEFPARSLADGERISLGEVELEIRETPGHTPESISIVVFEHATDDVPYAVLTGDALFIGDVGRPDLLASVGVSAGDLASDLYDSLHQKLMTLPDETRVYPAHGAGSACGKNLSTETSSTIGVQRVANYAVQPMSKDQFVDIVTEGQPTAPSYFSYDARRNRESRELLDEHRPPESLDYATLRQRVSEGAALIDTRDPAEFARGHLRDSVNVGLDGRFAEFVGSVVGPGQPIVLVSEPGTELEAKVRLGRIGYDRVVGALDHPYREMLEHQGDVQLSSRLTAPELQQRRDDLDSITVVDVRGPGERETGAIPGSVHIPLAQLEARLGELDGDRPTVVHCAGGYRSSIAASLLRREGFRDVSDLVGGYGAWAAMAS